MRKIKILATVLSLFACLSIGIKAHAMPYWYPEDISSFQFFHDEERARVVDDADLFTDEEESAMEARIAEIRSELNRDIVVFTDTSTYGLERKIYCADFYDFNGYGYGDEREGFCLLICMDPDDRGFYFCSTGPESRGLHTETVGNELTDKLLGYMKAAAYSAGVNDWIENIYRLYTNGDPFATERYLEEEEEIERFHDPDAPRVVDECDLFSDSEEDYLRERVAAFSAKYDTDLVIYTFKTPDGMATHQATTRFYEKNGYGYGDEYSGLLFVIEPLSASFYTTLDTFGDRMGLISSECYVRMHSNSYPYFDSGRCFDGTIHFLDDLEFYYEKGRVPKSAEDWGNDIVKAIVIGAVAGAILLLIAAIRMAPPRVKRDAYGYLVKESFKALPLADDYIGTSVTRTYSPKESSSGSYDSSYSGSSGASHTGSGSSF